MINEILNKFKALGAVTTREMGDLTKVKKHQINCYNLEGYGAMTLIKTKGDEAFIFTPLLKDAPLLIINWVGKEIQIDMIDTHTTEKVLNFYPMGSVKLKNLKVMDLPRKPAWYDDMLFPESLYKKGKPDECSMIGIQYAEAYIKVIQTAPNTEDLTKRRMTRIYVDDTLEQGGPIYDIFRKEFKDPTEEMDFFHQILFASEEYIG